MSELKPLEPGCMAVIINSAGENSGKVVTCLEFVGSPNEHAGKTFNHNDWWLLDRALPLYNGFGNEVGRYPYGRAIQLMRIDPEEGQFEEEREEQEVEV